MSWRPEVIADNSGEWVANSLRFATKEEAEANVQNLMMRWISVQQTRVVECDDPVNYRYTNGGDLIKVDA
jgi:nicotinamide riboside kinase